jgi:hypothetical protein
MVLPQDGTCSAAAEWPPRGTKQHPAPHIPGAALYHVFFIHSLPERPPEFLPNVAIADASVNIILQASVWTQDVSLIDQTAQQIAHFLYYIYYTSPGSCFEEC